MVKKYAYDWVAHYAQERGLTQNKSGRFPTWASGKDETVMGLLPIDQFEDDDKIKIIKEIHDLYDTYQKKYIVIKTNQMLADLYDSVKTKNLPTAIWIPVAVADVDEYQNSTNFDQIWEMADDIYKDVTKILDKYEPEDRTTRRAKVLEYGDKDKFEPASARSIWENFPGNTVDRAITINNKRLTANVTFVYIPFEGDALPHVFQIRDEFYYETMPFRGISELISTQHGPDEDLGLENKKYLVVPIVIEEINKTLAAMIGVDVFTWSLEDAQLTNLPTLKKIINRALDVGDEPTRIVDYEDPKPRKERKLPEGSFIAEHLAIRFTDNKAVGIIRYAVVPISVTMRNAVIDVLDKYFNHQAEYYFAYDITTGNRIKQGNSLLERPNTWYAFDDGQNERDYRDIRGDQLYVIFPFGRQLIDAESDFLNDRWPTAAEFVALKKVIFDSSTEEDDDPTTRRFKGFTGNPRKRPSRIRR